MESIECNGPSIVVIEELSDEEGDVMTITCKPRRRKKWLLAIEGPSDNKGMSVEEEVMVAGTNVAEVEDVQVAEQVEVKDVQVDEQGEEEHSDTFFDVPVNFEGDQEGSDEQDPEEDSDFVGSDEDNLNFAKYDVI
ncbi:hypothetical protein D8674_016867 [Pyrus ussuriensis x Pyrus communis]|uniref:Uncharacterized protein n=1 Tax=Pyrus ussuriensis x Pyrus communis TaxID=2448454 RepID=A0A5N5HE74_9ROSA|nr:hypothetical protein D8674_016867 [Pyrus ussuriensis x Pyrus communis]